MKSRDYRDILGGGLLVAAGGFAAYHAMSTLNVGTLSRMGAGMFPAALGVILAVFGAMMLVPALMRAGPVPQFRVWTPIFVFGGIAAFALLIRPFGIIPAVLALTVISSLAELRLRPLSLLALCVSMCLLAWLVFRVGLNLSTPLFRWPL